MWLIQVSDLSPNFTIGQLGYRKATSPGFCILISFWFLVDSGQKENKHLANNLSVLLLTSILRNNKQKPTRVGEDLFYLIFTIYMLSALVWNMC